MDLEKNIGPKVSIITTVLNSVETIEQTIVSVLGQTYKNIEYIVIDAASTDGTVEVIEKYRSRISVFISEPDMGISDGFNKGLSYATGEWIGIINGDDFYTPTAVQTIMDGRSGEVKVICGNILLTGNNGYKRVKKSKISWLNFGMFIMHPTCLIHKDVYNTTGLYNLKYKIAMDFDFFMRIKKNGFQMRHIDETIVHMRTGGASNNITKMHYEEIAVMKAHLKGIQGVVSYCYKLLDILRWKYFYKSPFGIVPAFIVKLKFLLVLIGTNI
jgi:glycosyltransferase involved in cell wall biosynthesis